MQKKFSVGDKVQWTSQSGGYETTKAGTVAFVVPANWAVWKLVDDRGKEFDLRTDLNGIRGEESYLVAVPGKTEHSRPLLYWPRTKNLKGKGQTHIEYDELAHFEKLLDEFEEDALAAAKDNSNTPSVSKRHQRDLTRSHLVALVEGIVLERDELAKKLDNNAKLVSVVAQSVLP